MEALQSCQYVWNNMPVSTSSSNWFQLQQPEFYLKPATVCTFGQIYTSFMGFQDVDRLETECWFYSVKPLGFGIKVPEGLSPTIYFCPWSQVNRRVLGVRHSYTTYSKPMRIPLWQLLLCCGKSLHFSHNVLQSAT